MHIILLLLALSHISWTFGQENGTRDNQKEIIHHDQIDQIDQTKILLNNAEAKDIKLNGNEKENGKDNFNKTLVKDTVGVFQELVSHFDWNTTERNEQNKVKRDKTNRPEGTPRKNTQDTDLDQIREEDLGNDNEDTDEGEKDKGRGEADLDKGEEDLDKGEEDLDKDEEDLDKGEEDLDKGEEDLDKGEEDLYKYEEDLDKDKENLDKGEADLDKSEDLDKGEQDLGLD